MRRGVGSLNDPTPASVWRSWVSPITSNSFHAGSLNFKSTSYEWLVVSGHNKAQFKGVGTIDGAGQYASS